MSDRGLFKVEIEGGCGDNIQIVATNGGLSVSVEEPWAGSTETGFGYHCNISLTREHAKKLRDFLLEWYPVNGTEAR